MFNNMITALAQFSTPQIAVLKRALDQFMLAHEGALREFNEELRAVNYLREVCVDILIDAERR